MIPEVTSTYYQLYVTTYTKLGVFQFGEWIFEKFFIGFCKKCCCNCCYQRCCQWLQLDVQNATESASVSRNATPLTRSRNLTPLTRSRNNSKTLTLARG